MPYIVGIAGFAALYRIRIITPRTVPLRYELCPVFGHEDLVQQSGLQNLYICSCEYSTPRVAQPPRRRCLCFALVTDVSGVRVVPVVRNISDLCH